MIRMSAESPEKRSSEKGSNDVVPDVRSLTEAVLARGGQSAAERLAGVDLRGGAVHPDLAELAHLIIELEARNYLDDSCLSDGRVSRIDRGESTTITVLCALVKWRILTTVGKSDQAISVLHQCTGLLQHVDRHMSMAVNWSLGMCYQNIGMMVEALASYKVAYEIAVELELPIDRANLQSEMAGLYLEHGDPIKALAGYVGAYEILVRTGDTRGADVLLVNVATATQRLGRQQEAIDIYQEIIGRGLLADDEGRSISILLNKALAHRTLEQFDAAEDVYNDLLRKISNKLPSRRLCRVLTGSAAVKIHQGNHDEALNLLNSARRHYISIGAIAEAHDVDGMISEVLWDCGERMKSVDILQHAFDQMKDSSFTRVTLSVGRSLHERLNQLAKYQEAYRVLLDCNELKDAVYNNEKERAQELSRVRSALTSEREALKMREEERRRILHSVLPPFIADRLLAGETRIAERLPAVGILFADIVGFTEFAASLQPDAVLHELEALFQSIDQIVERHECQRVKTIGDSYMASSGILSSDTVDHAVRLARCALEIVDLKNASAGQFSLRVGLHVGPVVAGVMQGMLIAYDLWGDAVNVAARLETTSSPGRIHISESMAEALLQSSASSEFSVTLRGDTVLKGKGVVQTYWLESAGSGGQYSSRQPLVPEG